MMEARCLKAGDRVCACSSLELEEEWDPSLLELLPREAPIYCHLQSEAKQRLKRLLIENYGSLCNASDTQSLNYDALTNPKCGLSIRDVATLDSAGFLADDFPEKIERFASSKRKSILPNETKVTGDIMYAFGLVSSDGCVFSNKKEGIYRVDFSNTNNALLEEYGRIIKDAFPNVSVR